MSGEIAVIESRQLRVLMVTPRYLPHIGGVERYVYEVSRRLARSGIEVTVLTTDPEQALPRDEEIEGVRILRVPAWPRGRDYYFAPSIYRVVAAGRWDVVHIQSYHTLVAPVAMIGALRHHAKYVVTFHAGGHSSALRRAIRGLQWRLLRPLLARANRLVAIAPFEIGLYERTLRVPRDRFVFIPSGIDTRALTAVDAEETSHRSTIASVGRLERYKGHHRVIEALPLVLEHRPDVRLWIAGAGPEAERLRRLAAELGVRDRVVIRAVPADQPERMARELSNVALVVLLSEYETRPLAILEAIALRRPVLVSYTTGLSDLADEGLVRAIPADSTAADVAEAILDQLRDPFVPARPDLPSWDDCAARHADLYSALLRTSSR